jgi:flagellar biosynthetic protein FlhB
MAEDNDTNEKTEEPSQYRIDQFRKKGDVAASREVNSVLVLAGTIFTLTLSSIYIFEVMKDYIDWLYQQDIDQVFHEEGLILLFKETLKALIKAVAPVFAVSFCLGIIAQVIQVGLIFAPDVLQMKFERINPMKGFKRIFSLNSIVEAIKGVFKFSVILMISYFILQDEMNRFVGYLHVELTQAFLYGQNLFLSLTGYILIGLLIIALADFSWTKFQYLKKLRMTREQVKEESKEKEGNPEVKQKIKTIQREMSRKRMMADVAKADVVVTNPTHYSVALQYDAELMVAPQVVGKGSDELALRIRRVAQENNIPIVENVYVARTLYKTVKIGNGVPRTLYKAVAEILAFVYKVKKRKKALS